MNNLKCIVIDDEQGAHLVIRHYVNKIKTLSLVGEFFNSIDALEFMHSNSVDLIFLDINMPGISGLEMLDTLVNKPYVIITTAYEEYAIKSYKYEVVDYLVKPFDMTSFILAINKVLNRRRAISKTVDSNVINHITLRVDGDHIMVNFKDILYIQSYGNYIKVFTIEKMLLTQSTTIEIESKLDKDIFVRIHRSYIISLKHIKKVSGRQVFIDNGIILPIGNMFKRDLLKHL
ncbi:LytTR family two component transcriptional regulator [Chryseobacterium sp. 7]|uniref:LytR/AlgR family response regulator transcription factor n=1 Tax=Chryseobacterium sp. 7 TaxID=2035214 RepID=UPI000EB151D9|nr:LytTR family DNA-binding domain-containing protein [Chryseobacterium sp. 7]RLJ30698.1 LytTR family two component transcriptional regulator [Chryseobacterium sp. 7]